VLYIPGRYFYFQNPQPNTMRLGFAGVDEKQIVKGVAAMGELLQAELRKKERKPRREDGGARVALI
jgi:DNA-binding transcriptional MocR family regulator